MISYRKTSSLRLKRASAPEPPFWCAATVAPYTPRRAALSIDYVDLRAVAAEKVEVGVCDRLREELERAAEKLREPVLIDAAEQAETTYRRGEETLAFCAEQQLAALELISTHGCAPSRAYDDAMIVLAAWPVEMAALERLAESLASMRWGLAVPLLFPVTTDLATLAALAELAKRHHAAFFAPIPVVVDPTAKQALARELDDETYATLFHSDLETLYLATERHIAALAASIGLADFVVPPRWERRSNWNGAALLTRTASRMLAMEHDLELASAIARSARLVAELDKPIERIAAAASLAIVDALDGASVDILTEWLEGGSSSFVEEIDALWRLRRDVGQAL